MSEVNEIRKVRDEKVKHYVVWMRGSTTKAFGPYDGPVPLSQVTDEILYANGMEYSEESNEHLISITVDDWGKMTTEVLANKHLTWLIAQRDL